MELDVRLDEQLVAAVERAKRDGHVGAERRDCGNDGQAPHRRNSRTIRLNSSAFSSCGMCPQLSMTTFFAPGIVRSSRSAPAGFASSSYLPHTISVGALTARTC